LGDLVVLRPRGAVVQDRLVRLFVVAADRRVPGVVVVQLGGFALVGEPAAFVLGVVQDVDAREVRCAVLPVLDRLVPRLVLVVVRFGPGRDGVGAPAGGRAVRVDTDAALVAGVRGEGVAPGGPANVLGLLQRRQRLGPHRLVGAAAGARVLVGLHPALR